MSQTFSFYIYSVPGSGTYSETVRFNYNIFEPSSIDQLMSYLPDNTGNLITAFDLRNSIFTLWKRTDELWDRGFTDFQFTSATPSLVGVGGWPKGSTFSNVGLESFFDKLLYPYTLPSVTFSISPASKFKGQTPVIQINWQTEKGSNPIQSLNILGVTVSVPTGSSSGSVQVNATMWDDTQVLAVVSDGSGTFTQSSLFTWTERIFWGTSDTFPKNFSSIDLISLEFSQGATALGLILDGESLPRINPAGRYLVFSWPTSWDEPQFVVNGMVTNFFTKTHGPGSTYYSSVTYSFGSYSRSYSVWMSDVEYYSTIDYIKITTY